jgi:hypothetical protein
MSTSNPSRIFARLVRGKSYYLRDKAFLAGKESRSPPMSGATWKSTPSTAGTTRSLGARTASARPAGTPASSSAWPSKPPAEPTGELL